MKRSTFTAFILSAILLGGIAGGVFVGGVAMGKDQGTEEAQQDIQSQIGQFASLPGQENTEQSSPISGGLGGFMPGGLMGGGATMGVVENVEDDTIKINTRQDTISIIIDESTSIQKMGEGSLDDILPGYTITVSGEQQEDESILATSILVVPGFDRE